MDSDNNPENQPQKPPFFQRIILIGMWITAISLVLFAVYVGWHVQTTKAASVEPQTKSVVITATPPDDSEPVAMADYASNTTSKGIRRRTTLQTIIPNRPRQEIVKYSVDSGDSVFGIAKIYSITPETVLWANFDLLNDNPDMLSPGMELNIPPVNGVYYQWEENDTIEGIATEFEASAQAILSWPGNKIDLTNPEPEPGSWVFIPDGKREFRTWIVPTIARENAGVSKSVYGPGACEGSYTGAYGSGAFAWPTASHFLSGNDYWSGHLGIDIAGSVGDGVFAADSGVVVFSGWSTGGYGYMIMIDHGNGYQSVYAHLSAVSAHCGQSVYQGNYIGAVGSTGNSTGSHLHFEVRYGGGFVSPWFVLPPP
jgi:murein DD-endopeptidase MepM/ murein hydrolase activator NlpD